MVDLFSELNTMSLIEIVERIKTPAKFLVDAMFPHEEVITQDYLPVEYSKQQRRLAPYIVPRSKGINMAREETQVRLYKCPLMGTKRVIGIDDISRRMIGEMPIVSTKTPEQRAQELAARDLLEMQRMLINRRAQQASELLQKGTITVEGYADDGKTAQIDTISFNCNAVVQKDWTAASADIYGDLKAASYQIQEDSGLIPTLLICGKNVEDYMLKNKEMKEWLLSANANATRFVNFQPQFTSPQIRHLGYISALNLEMVSYAETYKDGGQVKSFIDPDTVILCVPKRGKTIYGAVTLLNNKNWTTYAAKEIPIYTANDDSQTSSIALYSRCLVIPEDVGDWITFKVKA